MTQKQLIHRWAGGREGRSGNLYSDGTSIFYYGTWMGTRRGPDAFVLNSANFSRPTCKAQWEIRKNTSGVRHFVPNPERLCHSYPDPVTLAAILRRAVKVQARRTHAQLCRERRVWEQWETLRESGFLTEPAPAEWEHAEHFTPEAQAARKAAEDARHEAYYSDEAQAARAAKEEAMRQAREAARIAADTAELEKWAAGTIRRWSCHFPLPTRLRIKGDTLETSRGATVPLAIARRVYRKWMAGDNVTGTNVGGFTIRSVDDTSAAIGCHTILVEELHRVLGS